MIRICGGAWNGRKIKTPDRKHTRPTLSRVRESIFNILGQAVADAEVWDLYAGSGAIGFEALSRGAARAVFVDMSRGAMACLRNNLRTLGCEDRATLCQARLPSWLESPEFRPAPGAIVFLDPPYRENLADKTMQKIAALDTARAATLCLAQTDRKDSLAESYDPWRLGGRYDYGDSTLWLYEQGA